MGVLSFLRGTREPTATAEQSEPNLPPDLSARYRALTPRERRRLMQEAEDSAVQSVAFNPTRDYARERDAHIELELSGVLERVSQKIQAEFANPGDWRLHWQVVVGQDAPPDGLWGWMIIEAHVWPATTICRVPVAFATEPEARTEGEAAATKLWSKVNRQLAGG
jgi:hypothetical protein